MIAPRFWCRSRRSLRNDGGICLKLTELLEEEKDALLRAVRTAPTPEDAQAAVERTLERMLFAYNDAAPSPKARESAAAMTGVLRAALPLLACAGEPRLWETRWEKGAYVAPLPLALLILGCILCLAAGGLMLYHDLPPLTALLPAAGGLLLALTGVLLSRGRSPAERKIEVPTDWDRVYRTLHTAALVMDQTLDDAAAAERWEQRRRAEDAPALTPAETELMAELLEGLYGGDGGYALEKLAAVRRYLRDKGVDALDYDEAHAALFDRMPGAETATLCPALMQGAVLLRRGMATVPER